MTGLEKIIAEIQGEADREAEALLKDAKAKADTVRAEAKAESDKQVAEVKRQAEAASKDLAQAGESARALQRRKRILETKQMLLAETLQKAKEGLNALPDGQYFTLLAKLAGANAEPGDGEMLLSQKDLARVPPGYEAELVQALPAGSKLVISKQTRPINGGFVLKYGDIEENCSFDAIFAARRDEFQDAASEILFV